MQLSASAIIRSTILAVVGILITISIFKSKYHSDIGDVFHLLILMPIGVITVIVSLISDVRSFIRTKEYISFFSTYVILLFCLLFFLADYYVWYPFKKDTLVRVLNKGDLDGIGFDFKTDGTYIFDDTSVLSNHFEYGTYTISGNKITLDDNNLRLIDTRLLEIKDLEYTTYQDSVRKEKYLYQINDTGKVINDLNFKVVVDNRNKIE